MNGTNVPVGTIPVFTINDFVDFASGFSGLPRRYIYKNIQKMIKDRKHRILLNKKFMIETDGNKIQMINIINKNIILVYFIVG